MKRFAYLVALVASLVLATCTVTATGAYYPDDRPTHGPGAVALERSNDVVRPDDRAIHGQGAITVGQNRDVTRPDDHAIHGPGATALQQVRIDRVPVVAQSGLGAERVDGFDWLDAAIGAAAALGLGLILASATAFVLRRAQHPTYS